MGENISWLAQSALPWLPAGLWCAWWLFGVDWKNAWRVLASGGWVGVVLLTFLSALAWSSVFPTAGPSFLWRLLSCAGLALAALFCGWLQERIGCAPAEVSFDPPADAGHDAHHAHH